MERFFNRLKCEKGFELILTTLVVTGLIALGAGLYSLGKGAENAKADQVDITKYSEINASGDPGKDQDKNSAGLVEIAIKGGETAAGVYDDTGLLIILDKSGALKVTDGSKDESSNDNGDIKAKLSQKDLTDDKLAVDMAKIIKKQVKRKSTQDVSDEEMDIIVYEIIGELEADMDALDDLSEEDLDDIDDLEVIDAIEQSLEAEGKLEDPETIQLKKQLAWLESEKKYLGDKLASYKEYEDKGHIIADTTGLNALNDRLEDVEIRIAELNEKIGNGIQDTLKVTLSGQGNLLGYSESNITLTIDLGTGIVTGSIKCYGSQPYDSESNIYCRYTFNSDLNGSIDLETLKLSVKASGYVTGISGGVCAGLKPRHYTTTLSGTLNGAHTSISGTSSMGGTWSASR